tara:strand:+ start:924 stop:1718 length:795 start_codon:yes stop_codon:yes gene_type:complete
VEKKKLIIQKKINRPFFSVITVVKNSEKLIQKTILSIQNQKFKNFEYIIVDGLSSDNSLKNILQNKKCITHLLSEKDSGIYFAMNKGIRIAKGEIIVFVNAGDELSRNALSIIEKKFRSNSKYDFIFGTVKRYYTKETILKYGFNKQRLLYNFDFATAHSTGFYLKRKILKQIGGFNTKYKCSADYDLYFKLLIKKKLVGSYTKKNQLIGIVKSGGYSSKVSFFDHLLEETKIRIANNQNYLFVIIIFFNAIIKKIFKNLKNIY